MWVVCGVCFLGFGEDVFFGGVLLVPKVRLEGGLVRQEERGERMGREMGGRESRWGMGKEGTGNREWGVRWV